jgi:hypothetical protein
MGVRYFAFPAHTLHPINCDLPFNRTGSDGDVQIFPLFSTKTFNGLILDGDFRKADDGAILGPYTAKIANGELQLYGRSDSAGVGRLGVIKSRSKIYFYPGTIIDVHQKIDSNPAANEFYFNFVICGQDSGIDTAAKDERDALLLRFIGYPATTNIQCWKRINTSWTALMSNTAITYDEGTWRIKVHQDGRIQIFFHDGEGIVNEDTDEVVSADDLGLAFTSGYVGMSLETYTTANHTISSEGIYVYYPDRIQALALQPDVTNLYKGDCEVYDGDPSTTGIQVFSPNHPFTNDPYITNGILKLHLDLDVYAGFKLYCYDYTSTGWILPLDQFYIYTTTRGGYNMYPQLLRFEVVRRNMVQLRFRLYDNGSVASWIDGTATMYRGDPMLHLKFDAMDRWEYVRPIWLKSTGLRFGYAGDVDTLGIADTDLSIGLQNMTMTENYMLVDDVEVSNVIAFLAMRRKPGTRFDIDSSLAGMDLNDVYPSRFPLEFGMGLLNYPSGVLANLFTEAEADYHTGTEVYDATASNNYRVDLDAQDEAASHNIGASGIAPGRYLAVIRIKDSNNVWEDCQLRVQRNDTWAYLNQENTTKYHTLTSSWAYYFMIFQVPDDIGSALVITYVIKRWTDTNTISVDYFKVFPITNGMNFTQDHAHSYLRHADPTIFLPWRQTIL